MKNDDTYSTEQNILKATGIARMKDILRSHDIEMVVGGCGCCSSPWVTFRYKGEPIVEDTGYMDFDTAEKD